MYAFLKKSLYFELNVNDRKYNETLRQSFREHECRILGDWWRRWGKRLMK
jgi:hypothetical protein